MATHTLGTNASSSLTALKLRPAVTPGGSIASAADVATIDGLIADDKQLMGNGVIGTATASNGSATLTSASIATGTFGQIKQGQWAYGPGIPGGTQVLSTSGSSITLTNTYSGAGGSITVFFLGSRLPGSFSYNKMLFVPNRGWLKILEGDAVGVDASGWPILVSAEALAYSASSWTFT